MVEGYFTVCVCFDNADEFIPLNNPPEDEYKRSVWHWNVFRFCRIQDILFEDISTGEDIK